MTCPNCHQEIDPGAVFCGNCGFQIADQPAQAAPVPQPTVAPVAQPQSVTSAATQPVPPMPQPAYAPEAIPNAQHPVYQSVTDNTGGGVVSSTMSPASPIIDDSTRGNSKAITSFVCGILGCVGWLIPLVGVILGVSALVSGTIGIKSQRRVLAIIGIVLAIPVIAVSIFFWVRGAQQVIKDRSSPLKSITTPSTSSTTQSVTTPCYTLKIPASLTLTQTPGSCTFAAVNAATGEQYEVKALEVNGLTVTNLPQAAQEDAANAVNAIPGASIATQASSTFSSSPAYTVTLTATDGSAGTIDYVYDATLQGNLVIILHTQSSGKNYDLSSIEKSWTWQ